MIVLVVVVLVILGEDGRFCDDCECGEVGCWGLLYKFRVVIFEFVLVSNVLMCLW